MDAESFNPNRKPRDMPPSESSSEEYEKDDECKGDEEVVTPKSDLNNNKKESDLTVSEISKGIEGI